MAAELAELDPSIVVGKVDAEAESSLAEEYEAMAFPTIKWFEGGEEISEYMGENDKDALVAWVKSMQSGASTTLYTVDETESVKEAELAVVAYFPASGEGEDGPAGVAFRRLAGVNPGTAFFRTSEPEVATALGFKSTDGDDAKFLLLRNYPGHPAAAVDFATHSNVTAAADEPLHKQLTAFFGAEKLPDFIRFSDAQQDGGEFLLSVPVRHHLYIVGPDEKIAEVEDEIRGAAAQLRGRYTLLTAQPDASDPQSGDHVVAQTFDIDTKSTELFAGAVAVGDMRRHRCDISEGFTAAALVRCGEDILAGRGLRIMSSAPVPEDPKDGNVAVVVGSTFDAIVKDPTKDVLVEIYAPWCSACAGFAQTYARLAAALAEAAPSVVVAKMDGTANDVEGIEVEGYPTLLLFPAAEGAEPIAVEPGSLTELVEAVQKNAKVAFDAPADLAAFETLDVPGATKEFEQLGIPIGEEGFDAMNAGGEEDEFGGAAAGEDDDDEYLDVDHDEL